MSVAFCPCGLLSWSRIIDISQLDEAGCLTLQGNEFARKGKWKENGHFWQSAEFARNGTRKEQGWNLKGIDFARNADYVVSITVP